MNPPLPASSLHRIKLYFTNNICPKNQIPAVTFRAFPQTTHADPAGQQPDCPNGAVGALVLFG